MQKKRKHKGKISTTCHRKDAEDYIYDDDSSRDNAAIPDTETATNDATSDEERDKLNGTT